MKPDQSLAVLPYAEPSAGVVPPRPLGKFFRLGHQPFLLKGVTYGTFAPAPDGSQCPSRERVEQDFSLMARYGFNTVRLYTPPREEMLDQAQRHGLRLMIGVPWTQHVAFLDDATLTRSIRTELAATVKRLERHPASLLFAVGNEIPPAVVRWHGAARVERFLREVVEDIREAAPGASLTYVNYPPTEFLDLDFFDVCSFNVYLHDPANLRAYLARLQHIAGHKPLLLAEAGADSIREGEGWQAAITSMHVRTAFAEGACGVFAYAWTDEWWRGGQTVKDWRFGLVDEERRPKRALAAVSEAFAQAPFPAEERKRWPKVSVVVCAYNASDTLPDCLDSLQRLDYPDFEVVVVDDGSKDRTGEIAHAYESDPRFRVVDVRPNGGLSAARNVGLAHAQGEIVAYTDADVRVNPEWLTYLVQPFSSPDVVGSGGPNLVPSDDPWVAQCVARAPGGPTHVMLDDRTSEHVPGCNMAFRRDALLAVGGFNPIFLRAGDDVDLCWRLQARGWKIGFAPAALVWHHHRSTVKAYWRQQIGYGEGEVWLAPHHPDKFAGRQMLWRGRVYSPLPFVRSLSEARVNAGIWGTAPFPSVYHTDAHPLAYLPHSAQWQGLVVLLIMLGAGGLLAGSSLFGLIALGLGLSGLATTAVKCWSYAQNSDLDGLAPIGSLPPRASRRRYRQMIAWLHFIQPFARLRGRLRGLFTPPSVDGAEAPPALPERRRLPSFTEIRDAAGLAFGLSGVRRFWGERWTSIEDVLTAVTRSIRLTRQVQFIAVADGWRHDRDVSVGLGPWACVDLRALVEEHAGGRVLLRVATRLRITRTGIVALVVLLGSIAVAATSRWAEESPFLTVASVAGALAVTGVMFGRLIGAASALRRAVDRATSIAGMVALPARSTQEQIEERRPARKLAVSFRVAWTAAFLLGAFVGGVGLLRTSLPAAAQRVMANETSPGPSLAADLDTPGGIAVSPTGAVYYADAAQDVIRRFDPRGFTTTLSGTLGRAEARRQATAPFGDPGGLALTAEGDLLLADARHDRVFRLDRDTGALEVVAGSGEQGFAGDDGPAVDARLDTPSAVAVAPNGDLYIADSGNNRVRRVEAATGVITTVAGTGEAGDPWSVGDWGPATGATLDSPSDVAIGPDNDLYIADMGHNRVRRLDLASGEITTVAGCGAFGSWGDGWHAPSAALAGPTGLAVVPSGKDGKEATVYVADYYNGRVRVISPDGTLSSLLTKRDRAFGAPTRVAWSPRGWLYVADALRGKVTAVRAPRPATTATRKAS
jgi:GT2 family glycosyltransferase/DNA-binding beta-propeller fold protein YncE